MNLRFTPQAEKSYKKLSSILQKKADKQFFYLLANYRHPSLRARKMTTGLFEGRIDYQYRFTFEVKGEIVYILSLGPHDTGLGKK